MVQTEFKTRIKVIRSDNGRKFTLGPIKKLYDEQGLIHETSCYRHVLNVARALRFKAHLLLEFWGECVLAAAHLINRTPAQILNGKTPYEALFERRPSLDHIRIFGWSLLCT